MRYPTRKAVCPHCGRRITAYVPTADVESLDGSRKYIFRAHKDMFKRDCAGWAQRVPDDAFEDFKPNIDSADREVS